jgi:hypothetical protein
MLCHQTVPVFGEEINVPVAVSNLGQSPGCMGCHGRTEDAVPENPGTRGKLGTGLKQHHFLAGIRRQCISCHPDSNPLAYTPVGEDVMPPYYGALVPALDSPCDDLLDNDGDFFYDSADDDCGAQPECIDNPDCDDALFCNGAETCVAGQCQEGMNPCSPGETCDEANDQCIPSAECTIDADCIDSMFCNGDEMCVGGECMPGTPPDCDDGIACTDDSCDTLLDDCVNSANDANCPDDGLFCNGTEFCDAVDDCSSTGNPCALGEECVEPDQCIPAPECVTDCDCYDAEGNFCNGLERCVNGVCEQPLNPPCGNGFSCNENLDICEEVAP